MRRRRLGRYREIAGILARHGLGAVAAQLGLTGGGRAGGRAAGAEPGSERAADPALGTDAGDLGRRLRRVLEDLGPTFVKLGQIMSTRADLLPPDLLRELEKLQDQVQPVPFPAIREVIERELGRSPEAVFAAIDPVPLAAASIGQVHAARLQDGADVVIKVQRPGARETVEADLDILHGLAELADRHSPWAGIYSFRDLAREVERSLRAELDYEREAENAERLGRLLAAHPDVRVPRVYWTYTTPRVLVLERLHGRKLWWLLEAGEPGPAAEAAAQPTPPAGGGDPGAGPPPNPAVAGDFDRRHIARRLAVAVLEQILVHGFFHADPHPGNLLLMPDGRIGLLDFGVVGSLSEVDRRRLRRLVLALMRQDGEAVAEAALALVETTPHTDRSALLRDLDEARRRFVRRPLRRVDLGQVVGTAFGILRRHRVRVPPELALVGKTLVTLEGVVSRLDPEVSVLDLAEPIGRRLLRQQVEPAEIGRRLGEVLDRYALPALELPGLLHEVLKQAREGRPLLRVDVGDLEALRRSLSRVVNRLAFSILLLALSILLGAMVVALALSGRSAPLWGAAVVQFGVILLAAAVTTLLWSIYRSGRM